MSHTPQHTTAARERLAALIEDLEWLLEQGESHANIAERLGSSPTALARRLHRAGRHDLARPFGRLANAERRRECADCGKPGIDKKATHCRQCAPKHWIPIRNPRFATNENRNPAA